MVSQVDTILSCKTLAVHGIFKPGETLHMEVLRGISEGLSPNLSPGSAGDRLPVSPAFSAAARVRLPGLKLVSVSHVSPGDGETCLTSPATLLLWSKYF